MQFTEICILISPFIDIPNNISSEEARTVNKEVRVGRSEGLGLGPSSSADKDTGYTLW
jgi:hypothetical protein